MTPGLSRTRFGDWFDNWAEQSVPTSTPASPVRRRTRQLFSWHGSYPTLHRDAEGYLCDPELCESEALKDAGSCAAKCVGVSGGKRLVAKTPAGSVANWAFVFCLLKCGAYNYVYRALSRCAQHRPCGDTCCIAPEVCCDGVCCPVPESCCAGVCCPEGYGFCNDGKCSQCPTGFTLCPESSQPTICWDLRSNDNMCGSCHNGCAPSEICCDGHCVPDYLWVRCGGACMQLPPCGAPKSFSHDTCACECPGVTCGSGLMQDPVTCLCVEKKTKCPPPHSGVCYGDRLCCANANSATCCLPTQWCDPTPRFATCRD